MMTGSGDHLIRLWGMLVGLVQLAIVRMGVILCLRQMILPVVFGLKMMKASGDHHVR
jgi:hypothetical protein